MGLPLAATPEGGTSRSLQRYRRGQSLAPHARPAPFQMTRQTIHDDVTVLERVLLLDRLPPWHSNRLSRLVKAAKLHRGDTGLACALRGIDAVALHRDRERLGPLLETFELSGIAAPGERPRRLRRGHRARTRQRVRRWSHEHKLQGRTRGFALAESRLARSTATLAAAARGNSRS